MPTPSKLVGRQAYHSGGHVRVLVAAGGMPMMDVGIQGGEPELILAGDEVYLFRSGPAPSWLVDTIWFGDRPRQQPSPINAEDSTRLVSWLG